MTLIATLKAGPSQILFGDLLISGAERVGYPLNVPGLGSVHQIFPEGSGFMPINLRQKVCLLNDYLAVAWAGPRYDAQATIRELSELPRPITIDGIRSYFSGVNISRDSAFICLLLDENVEKEFIFWIGATQKAQTRKFGEVRAAGTGLDCLGGALDVLENTNLDYFTSPQYESPRFVMLQNVARVTSILQLQGLGHIENGKHSLLNYFGGGFETVYAFEGRLRKLDSICYVFWEFRSASETVLDLKMNPIVLYSTYIKDFLFLRVLSFFPRLADDGLGLLVKESAIYVIPPIHKDYPTEDVLALYKREIKPEVFCHHASIYKMDNTPFTGVNLFEAAQNSDFEIIDTNTDSGEATSLKIGDGLISKIAYQVAKTYRE